ncbi:MAG: hypothetical protein ACJ8OJ_15885 [Povalibacter sp.]
MHRIDKANLRLAVGMGLAVLIAYGAALPVPFAVCVMVVIFLCKPGPPLPLAKGIVIALVLAAILTAGVLMVPVLENYAFTGIVLTAAVLYVVFLLGARSNGAITTILALAFVLMPVAGVAEQALVSTLAITIAVGVLLGVLVGGVSHALFPDSPTPPRVQPAVTPLRNESAQWIALRATLIVMPVFVLALTNPSLYVATIMKTVALSQQAEETKASDAGRELVGSTFMGALIAAVLWMGLSLLPNLWMLMLWMILAALWTGARLFGARRSAYPPSFWSNALITALILFGPAIEDSATGKSVMQASLVRTALFVAVALYAWGTIHVLEHWRNARLRHQASLAQSFSGGRP